MENNNYYEKTEQIENDELFILLQNLNTKLRKANNNIDEIFRNERIKIDKILEKNRVSFSQSIDKKYLLSNRSILELNKLFKIQQFGTINITIEEWSDMNNFYRYINTQIDQDLQIDLVKFNSSKDTQEKEMLFDKMYRKYNLLKLKERRQIEIQAEWKESGFDYNINWKDYTDFTIPKNEEKLQYNGTLKAFNRENIYIHNNKNGDRLGDSPKIENRPANIYLPKCRETYNTLKCIPFICDEDTFIKSIILQECSHKNYNASEAESEIPSLEIGQLTYLSFRLPSIINTYFDSNKADIIGPGYNGMYGLYVETLKELVSQDKYLEQQIKKNKIIQSCASPGEEINSYYKAFPFLFTDEFSSKFINLYKEKVQKISKKYKN